MNKDNRNKRLSYEEWVEQDNKELLTTIKWAMFIILTLIGVLDTALHLI